MNNFEHLQTHLYAVVRDESGNVMTICERLEFCVNNECIAVFEGRWLDLHYFKRGVLFHVYKGRKLIRTAGTHINFSKHTLLEERIDRFEVSSYDFCHLLKTMFLASTQPYDEWIASSVDNEYAHWLGIRVPFDPMLLAFLCSDEAARVVYGEQLPVNQSPIHSFI
ncbi:hypothetical protein [Spirosoma sp.]|uniref:hypothetical protein n=1 Tax=Spirosoma sp. TaxID=1899569 RepID=UPI00261EE6B8|nr:hypothetical protein [Spirosoma sp.]MCX6216533.1 hypothetical protein [Spirosoma sp.]